jgi:hypothetical protein
MESPGPMMVKTKNLPCKRKVAETRKHQEQHQETALIVDITGRITACGSAVITLLCQRPERLFGQAITKIIPKLPFGSNTPYYNFAYAVFHGANGALMQRTAFAPDGRAIPVDVQLSGTVMNGRRLIKLDLQATCVAGPHSD